MPHGRAPIIYSAKNIKPKRENLNYVSHDVVSCFLSSQFLDRVCQSVSLSVCLLYAIALCPTGKLQSTSLSLSLSTISISISISSSKKKKKKKSPFSPCIPSISWLSLCCEIGFSYSFLYLLGFSYSFLYLLGFSYSFLYLLGFSYSYLYLPTY